MLQRPAFLLVFCVLAFAWSASAAHNVTIDDTDPSITYIPQDGWEQTLDDPLNIGGSHMVTASSSAIATLNFLGTAVYFYSPLWPFHVTTAISLDNAAPVTLDLQDYNSPVDDQGAETVPSNVVWSVTGLQFTQHSLIVSVAAGENFAILDAVVYTVPDPGDTSTTSSTIATSTRSIRPTSVPAAAVPQPGAKKGLSIALGIVCTVFGVLVIGALFWWWRKRKKNLEQKEVERLQALGSPSGTNESTPSMSDAGREWELFGGAALTIPRRKQISTAPSTSPTTSNHARRQLGAHTPSTPSPLNPAHNAARRNKTLSTIREDSQPMTTHLAKHVPDTVSAQSEVQVLETDRRMSSSTPSRDSIYDWQVGRGSPPSRS